MRIRINPGVRVTQNNRIAVYLANPSRCVVTGRERRSRQAVIRLRDRALERGRDGWRDAIKETVAAALRGRCHCIRGVVLLEAVGQTAAIVGQGSARPHQEAARARTQRPGTGAVGKAGAGNHDRINRAARRSHGASRTESHAATPARKERNGPGVQRTAHGKVPADVGCHRVAGSCGVIAGIDYDTTQGGICQRVPARAERAAISDGDLAGVAREIDGRQ